MKIVRCFYNDDEVLVAGLLIVGIFKSTFYPLSTCCGWDKQAITRKNRNCIVLQKGKK
jgi:hypothetical protein